MTTHDDAREMVRYGCEELHLSLMLAYIDEREKIERELGGIGGFGCDPGDSAALLALRQAIDDHLEWETPELEEAADYIANVERCGSFLVEQEAELKSLRAKLQAAESSIAGFDRVLGEIRAALGNDWLIGQDVAYCVRLVKERAETAERENERLRLENGALKDEIAQLYETEDEQNSWRRDVEQRALEKMEQARAEGYELGKAERASRSYCGRHIEHWGVCCRHAGHADECLAYEQVADPKQNPKGLGL